MSSHTLSILKGLSSDDLKIIDQLLNARQQQSYLPGCSESENDVSLVDDYSSDDGEESISKPRLTTIVSKNLKLEPSGISGERKGRGLFLRYSHAYRSKTIACKTGISFEELNRILNEWDETHEWKSVAPHAMPNPVPNNEWDDYLPRLVPLTENLSNYRIFHLEKEAQIKKWIKYIIYNKKTKMYILRSATGESLPSDPKEKKAWGKCVPSHSEGWSVNETNIISDKTFWKRVKQRLALY